jgi:hypothetical protein
VGERGDVDRRTSEFSTDADVGCGGIGRGGMWVGGRGGGPFGIGGMRSLGPALDDRDRVREGGEAESDDKNGYEVAVVERSLMVVSISIINSVSKGVKAVII